jgi:hypothetical protein
MAAALVLASVAPAQDAPERARRIHARKRVLNGREDISRRLPNGHVDLPRLKDAGMVAPFFALWVPTYYKGSEAVRRTLQLRDAMQAVLDEHPDMIELATTAADVERIAGAGRIAAVLTLEGGHQIANDLAVLRVYHRLGLRSMTLTHFRNNDWADASTDRPRHNGLTDFGRHVVREMNRLGMIVDILRRRIGEAVATEPALVGRDLDEFAAADYLKEYRSDIPSLRDRRRTHAARGSGASRRLHRTAAKAAREGFGASFGASRDLGGT